MPSYDGDARDEQAIREGALEALVHETTNVLTVMLGWLERAKTGDDLALAQASEHGEALRKLLRGHLLGARNEATSRPANELNEQLGQDMQWLCQQRQLRLRIDSQTSKRVTEAHTVWRILTNLLLNAITMTPAGGNVTLRCDLETENTIRFSVEDSGPGVSRSMQSALFRAGKSERSGGSGLGLWHAKQEAERCGGQLSYVDQQGGALFVLRWPATAGSEERPARLSATKEPALSLAGMRVLLLEDDRAVVDLLELSLSARGAAITSVSQLEELHQALENKTFDLLLVDLSPLGLPVGQELDRVVNRARAHNADIAIVTISGSISVQPRSDIMWLRKPFSPRELTQTILEATRRHRWSNEHNEAATPASSKI